MDIMKRIIERAQAIQPELAALRRDFHHYPETGWLEMRTSAIIAKRLTELGYDVKTGRAVCAEGARMGLPDADTLRRHAQEALRQGAPAAYLTPDMAEGFTGVIGELRCGEGPVLALRFDIDALGMTECPEQTHRPTR